MYISKNSRYVYTLSPFAFAVSIILYTVADAVAPLGVSAKSQFLKLCSIEHNRKNWLFSDTPEGAQANTLYLTIVEMAKAYDLDLYKYLNFLFEKRPNKDMSDDELDKLAPWNETVKATCKIK